jgi:antirestriction protein
MCEMNADTPTLAAVETDSPSVWVGCLGCYNNGSLFGEWVDGLVATDLVAAGIAVIKTIVGYTAARCVRCFSDEFHVFDHENFGPFLDGECSPWQAQQAAEAMVAFNEAAVNSNVPKGALLAFAANEDLKAQDFAEWIEDAQDRYEGQWESTTAFAEDYTATLGLLDGVSETVAHYFNYADFYCGELRYEISYLDGGYVFRDN